MKNKIIITEKQLDRLKSTLKENTIHSSIVKQMKDEKAAKQNKFSSSTQAY